jgi:uroporphyrin-III C-methyltransferase/precorrin-2 dehydrogenase/sirohydrochlorin ferrochelatase
MSDADSRPAAPAHPALFPAFLRLTGKRVLVVGAGPVAASKLKALVDAEADITVVAPDVHPDIEAEAVTIHRRPFELSDLDGVWYVVAAAPPEVNRAVSAAAAARHLFVNAVDDPPNASVYLGAIVKREDVILAISTSGRAPALAGLLREGLDRLLPADLQAWLRVADAERVRWKAAGIPMEARRPELLRALNAIYVGRAHHEGSVEPEVEAALFAPGTTPESLATRATTPESSPGAARGALAAAASAGTRTGLVSLVGAGPGDPELLTARAHTRLAEADVVLYDALVSPAILALASHARCLSVGKRHGRHSVSQDTINRLLVRGAKRQQRLVRLKAGDPYVFGRGGEEALALAAAGLPFEVVPGVSSAIAAPALAGIPVTHRGLASGVLVVSGHAESSYAPALDSLAPKGTTLVVLMGVNTRAQIAGRLLARGWADTTPVALLFAASTPDARTWIGTLGDLVAGAPLQLPESPGTLVVGDVVSLAATLVPASSGGLQVTDAAGTEPAASNE